MAMEGISGSREPGSCGCLLSLFFAVYGLFVSTVDGLLDHWTEAAHGVLS